MAHARTRGSRNVMWIENFCLVPSGPDKGQRVRLSPMQREIVRKIYNAPNDPANVPVSGPLAGYLALLHTAGPEALQDDFRPALHADFFTVLNAAGPDLKKVLKIDGEKIRCPELGTRFPVTAA